MLARMARGDAKAQKSDSSDPTEALVNAVNLLFKPQASGDGHRAAAHVTVQREVGRQGHNAMLLSQMPAFKSRRALAYAQGLGLVAAGNGAAIIVGQHYHGPRLSEGRKARSQLT